mmetsp:Transcript_11027/g.30818  ORF Transcript_11027/g.30818 Transcript_11027/m.30818 type:complete len:82 (+) Transcript_11027:106-351(+)
MIEEGGGAYDGWRRRITGIAEGGRTEREQRRKGGELGRADLSPQIEAMHGFVKVRSEGVAGQGSCVVGCDNRAVTEGRRRI